MPNGLHLPGQPWRSRAGDPNLWIAGSRCPGFFCVRRSHPIAFRELRVNDQIRIPQIRLFDDTTQEAFGIVALEQAKQMAIERELDLVEVAPLAQPPVCRLMDYGRFKFEALKREKESRREHSVVHVKEMKLRPKISEHDFQTKFGYVRQFLKSGDKVKLTIMFRGREMVHQEYGRRLLDRMADELKDHAIIERTPLVEGRNMIMILSPLAKKAAKGPEIKAADSRSGAATAARIAADAAGHVDPAPMAPVATTAATATAEAPAPAPEAPEAPAPSPAPLPEVPAPAAKADTNGATKARTTTAKTTAAAEKPKAKKTAAKAPAAAKATGSTTAKPRGKTSTRSTTDAKDSNP